LNLQIARKVDGSVKPMSSYGNRKPNNLAAFMNVATFQYMYALQNDMMLQVCPRR
jgi:hypothetical protein